MLDALFLLTIVYEISYTIITKRAGVPYLFEKAISPDNQLRHQNHRVPYETIASELTPEILRVFFTILKIREVE